MLKGLKGQKWELPGLTWWAAYFHAYGLPSPVLELRFDQTMRRLDLAWPSGVPLGKDGARCAGLAVEMQGGTRIFGKHVRHAGFVKDRKKVFDAQTCGWIVLESVWEQVKSGELPTLVEQGLYEVARRINGEKGNQPPTGG